ncbi:phage minor head protein, partial [Amycolatopsis sp.]|uniref:phage minor head protein n=1 Tax=Amycolatopsis sp. TaxID=37632 RepID=UPI002D7E82BC
RFDAGDYRDAYLADTSQRLTSAKWPDDVYNSVRAEVVASQEAREPLSALRARVAEVLNLNTWLARAATIARTEALAGLNGGLYAAGQARQRILDVALHKQWISVSDHWTRDAHRLAHGQVVPGDGVFTVGGEPMRYPHDPAASAAQTVNCRCVLNWLDAEEAPAAQTLYEQARPHITDQQGRPVMTTAAADTTAADPAGPPDSPDGVTEVISERTETTTVRTTSILVPEPPELEDEDPLYASASGAAGLPIAAADTAWDGPAAVKAVGAWADGDAAKLGRAFFWRDPKGDPKTVSAYKLPFATVVDGTLTAIPQGIFAAAAAVQGSRGGASIPTTDVDAVKARIGGYYSKLHRNPPWGNGKSGSGKPAKKTTAAAAEGQDELVASATPAAPVRPVTTASPWARHIASAVATEPPAAWFQNPELTGPTKLRVTDSGRVYGHLAAWDSRHVVHDVPPPRDPYGGTYPKFHRHPLRTAEGDIVKTGPIAAGTHGNTGSIDMVDVMRHYDDPRFVAADVVVGEDQHGIWASGAVRPGVSPELVDMIAKYDQSGHWLYNELLGSCCVTVGAYWLPDDDSVVALAASADPTIPRPDLLRQVAHTDDAGNIVAIVAAGVLAHPEQHAVPFDGVALYRQFKAAEAADQRVTSARRRMTAPAITAAASRIRGE